jgi:membrane protein required for beta-lactamase induction
MKKQLQQLAAPILNPLENSEGDYQYSPSHRKVLKIMGFLFIMLGGVGLYFSLLANILAGLFPVILFTGIGLLCLVVGYLGSDKAVAKLWRNRNETHQ